MALSISPEAHSSGFHPSGVNPSGVNERRQAAPAWARSFLFVPADRPERIAKAWASGADAVIVDLEDAVAPAAKDAARAALATALTPARPIVVRINAATSPWFAEDVRLCGMPGVGAVMLPKAEEASVLRDLLVAVADTTLLLPLIETARGLWNALELARVQRVQRLAFGPLDFQLDLGLSGGDDELATFRSQLVLASRVAEILAPIDGPTTAIHDVERVRSDTLRARRAGFGAKLGIHPQQIGAINAAFDPGAEETAWAQRIMAAAQEAQGGAFAMDGKMVDQPVLARAERILRQCRDRDDAVRADSFLPESPR
jgi:citrate lyase subunit beta/citryl-CoA lyase